MGKYRGRAVNDPFSLSETALLRKLAKQKAPLVDVAKRFKRSFNRIALEGRAIGYSGWMSEVRARYPSSKKAPPPPMSELAHFRITATYKGPLMEVQERIFCDEPGIVSAVDTLPPAMMGCDLLSYSVAKRECLGGGVRRWVDASSHLWGAA